MKTFEQWYNSTKKADSIVEATEDSVPVAKSSTSIESDTATVVASPETTGEEGYSKMMQDCDDIINSLKTLSDQLTESEDQPLNEANPMGQVLMEDPIIMGAVLGLTAVIGAVGLGAKAIKDGAKNKKTIKEAEKDYSKLKKLKMQTVKMEVAVLSLEDKRRELSTTESIEEAGDDVKAKASAANKKKALQKMKAKLDNQIESMRQKKDGINSAATEYGSSLEVKTNYSATITQANKEKAFNWLRENNLGDIIKNEISVSFGRNEDNKAADYAELAKGQGFQPQQKLKVEPMTLKALVLERIEAGKEMPTELFNVFVGNKTNIKRKQ